MLNTYWLFFISISVIGNGIKRYVYQRPPVLFSIGKNKQASTGSIITPILIISPFIFILIDELGRDNKSLTKQVERLKQQMEEKAVNLENLTSKMKIVEREKLKLIRDLEQWDGEQSKMDALERENRELSQSRNDERKSAMNLREDLIKERMKSDQIKDTMEGLHKQLKKLGLDPNKLDAGTNYSLALNIFIL